MSYHNQVRVILIGDSKVGKTSLLYRLKVKTGLLPNTTTTIGVDFHTITMQVNGVAVDFQLWDTAGQEDFRSITRAFFRNAVAGYLVFDLTKRESFYHLSEWISEAKSNCHPDHGIVLLLVGNKADLVEEREVTYDEAEDFAKEHSMNYVETSAKSGANVQETLRKLVEVVIEHGGSAEITNWDESSATAGLQVTNSITSCSFAPAPENMVTNREKRACCKR